MASDFDMLIMQRPDELFLKAPSADAVFLVLVLGLVLV